MIIFNDMILFTDCGLSLCRVFCYEVCVCKQDKIILRRSFEREEDGPHVSKFELKSFTL